MHRIAGIIAVTAVLIQCARFARSQDYVSEAELRQHYDAAYRLQSAGRPDQADREYVAFLIGALDRLGNGFANIGDYAKAKPIYGEALKLAPDDLAVLRTFAAAAFVAKDDTTASQLISSVFSRSASLANDDLARLQVLRGKLQIRAKGRQADLTDFKSAVELDPSCENIYALASAEVAVSGPASANGDYKRYISRCGNTPAVHIMIGRAYAINGAPDLAFAEFHAASILNPRSPGVHYCMGASLLQSSKLNFGRAEAEFRKELALHPNDGLSYAQLGQIAILRHYDRAAEDDFRHAIQFNPREPSNYIGLGQLLARSNRDREAEPVLRKAIQLTPDPSRNSYEIERAYFQLGRILEKRGDKEEAARELKVAADLLNRSRQQAESELNGKSSSHSDPLAVTRIPTEHEKSEVDAYARRISRLLASAYNNLGVHMTSTGRFSAAAVDFAAAERWNPKLPGVDANWGRAAYLAGMCGDALPPLQRAVRERPADTQLSNMLDLCKQHTSTPNEP